MMRSNYQTIVIKSNSGLSDEEIDKMMKDAEANADADAKRKEEVDTRNEADALVFQTEKTLKDLEGKVEEAEVKKAEDAKEELKKALEGEDIDDIKAKSEALSEIAQNLAVKLYEQAAAAQQAAGASQEGPTEQASSNNDGVVDADFEEVD